MVNIFAASEIVELGIQIEINGRDFYSMLATKTKNKKAKETFRYLAGEEEDHIKVFRQLLGTVHKYQPKEAYPEEYFAYMNSLASGSVFTQKDKGKEIAKKVKDEEEAIDMGINAEEDSIIFYEKMKEIVPYQDKTIIDKVITEEQNHLEQLEDLKESL